MEILKTDQDTLRKLVRKYGPYKLDDLIDTINSSVWEEERPARIKKEADNRDQYILRKIEEARVGEEIAKTLEPGMIVKVRGTKNNGVREIVAVYRDEIVGHHLTRHYKDPKGEWRRGSYITTHGFDKIVKVLEHITIKS